MIDIEIQVIVQGPVCIRDRASKLVVAKEYPCEVIDIENLSNESEDNI